MRGRLAGWRAAPAGGTGASSRTAAAGDDPDSDDGEDQRARAPGVQNFTTWVWTLLSSSVTVKVRVCPAQAFGVFARSTYCRSPWS